MELPNEAKREVVREAVLVWEKRKYMHEVMGKSWQLIGNSDAAKQCADEVATSIKHLDNLNKQMEELA